MLNPSRRSRKRFLVLTAKGFDFVKNWFDTAESIPSDLTRLYQLLLRIITMGGTLPLVAALKMKYTKKVIQKAVTEKYAELTHVAKKPPKELLKRMNELIGEPPKEMYA